MEKRGFIFDLHDEMENSTNVHRKLVERIECITRRRLICYYASPNHPLAGIMAHDPDILENVLRSLDLVTYEGRLDLLITSGGGDPYAAEKIVQVFKTFGTHFRVIVANRAMSAATLVCFGADELAMTKTACLGPIDPQITLGGLHQRTLPARAIIDAFNEMLKRAQEAMVQKQPPDPYLAVLRPIDAGVASHVKQIQNATQIIAADLLKKGLMKGVADEKLNETVKLFVEKGETELHARRLYPDFLTSSAVGMKIEILDSVELTNLLAELMCRIDRYCEQGNHAKYILAIMGGINLDIGLKNI